MEHYYLYDLLVYIRPNGIHYSTTLNALVNSSSTSVVVLLLFLLLCTSTYMLVSLCIHILTFGYVLTVYTPVLYNVVD
jgi:hypothetical protein